MGGTSKNILEKIPAEKRWAITAKILTRLITLRPVLTRPFLYVGEGIIAPVMGYEKMKEINEKIWGEGGKKMLSMVKEKFNIPVEDAVGAAKLYTVAGTLVEGPEFKVDIIEETRDRVVFRRTQCAWFERYKDLDVDPEHRMCDPGHQGWGEKGFKAINPNLNFKIMKSMPRGDPYCEVIIEFKDE